MSADIRQVVPPPQGGEGQGGGFKTRAAPAARPITFHPSPCPLPGGEGESEAEAAA